VGKCAASIEPLKAEILCPRPLLLAGATALAIGPHTNIWAIMGAPTCYRRHWLHSPAWV